MKWTLKLVTELDSGETKTQEVTSWERVGVFIKPAILGISIDESKQIAASIQAEMVSDQVEGHNNALKACRFCGRRVRTKGYHKSVLKSVFGKMPMRPRRVPMPFGKVADFLGELLPASAKTNATMVRNRVLRVGRRLEKAAAKVELPQPDTAVPEIVVGLDGGYVRGESGPERNFEVVAGRVLLNEMTARFAFVRQGTGSASRRVRQAMIQADCTEDAHVTVLSDGDAGLRAIQREVAQECKRLPEAVL